jgi:hypothetical protein
LRDARAGNDMSRWSVRLLFIIDAWSLNLSR